jgi:uncharacterized membrane protein YphA (DoxX/SURF4 family)
MSSRDADRDQNRLLGATVERASTLDLQNRNLVHGIARLTLGAVFLYHGLVPKLLVQHEDELRLLAGAGVPAHLLSYAVTSLGLGEIAWGLLLLLHRRARWPFLVTAAAMLVALLAVAASAPGYLVAAFNVVTLNLAMIAISVIGWLTSACSRLSRVGSARHSASRCW